MTYFDHAFETHIVAHNVGKYRYSVVFLDPAIAALLPFAAHPQLRFEGEINDYPFAAAWQPSKGRHYAMLSKTLLRETGLAIGDRVEVRFRVADQDAVDVPEELADALAEDAALAAIWDGLTAGRRRGFAIWIGDAKAAAVRARRLAQFAEAIRAVPALTPIKLSWKGKAVKAAATETPSR